MSILAIVSDNTIATKLTKYLRQPEIDFIHGRTSSSVFMKHYFNPALIGDMQKRAIKATKELSGFIT